MNIDKVQAAINWARSLQQRAPVSAHHERAVAELMKWLDLPGIRNVLELGCGEPPYLLKRELEAHGCTVIGLDQFPGCDVRGDMHDLPFADNSFDLVAARHVLEHVLIPYLALMEMRRVTCRYLLVVVPWVSEKTVNWPDHLYVLPREAWERIFTDKMRLRILHFEEGDHTEQFALDQGLWADHEWRYLLEKEGE